MSNQSSYPLEWPIQVPRTMTPQRARFGAVGMGAAIDGLRAELRRLGALDVVVSSNVALRIDGFPRAGLPEPKDAGVAVYFRLFNLKRLSRPYCLPCDRWHRVAHNIRAIALHIEAMRGMERWGVGSIEQAFAGYAALPAPGADWWAVFGIEKQTLGDGGKLAVLQIVEARFAERLKAAHPDLGGSHEEMVRLNAARAAARAELAR